MRYTLRQLNYFVAAAESLSVTRAADRLHVSQPAISAAIAHLEAELDVQLFVRHHAQGLALTEAGRRIAHAARQALQSAGALHDIADSVRDRIEGRLRVGTFYSLAPLIAPELWAGFCERFPRVQMTMSEGGIPDLIAQLRDFRIDLALTWNIQIPPEIDFFQIASMRPYVLVSAAHRYAGRGSVRLAEMADEPMVLVDVPGTREYYMGFFDRAGLSPKIVTRTASTSALRSYVAAGIGYGVMTSRPRNRAAENNLPLAYLAIADMREEVAFGIARLSDLRLTRAAGAFIDFCQTHPDGAALFEGADHQEN